MSEPNPYEATKHLSELHDVAWRFDRLPEGDRFRTDGLMMVRRDAVEGDRMEIISYAADDLRPMADAGGAEVVWESSLSGSLYEVHVSDVVNVGGECSYFAPYEVLAVLEPTDGDGDTVYVNAHKLRLACYWTRADSMEAKSPAHSVVLYRGGDPVALVMPVREGTAEKDIAAVKEALAK